MQHEIIIWKESIELQREPHRLGLARKGNNKWCLQCRHEREISLLNRLHLYSRLWLASKMTSEIWTRQTNPVSSKKQQKHLPNKSCKYVSMTSLLANTVAQPTKWRFLPKNLNELVIFVIELVFTWSWVNKNHQNLISIFYVKNQFYNFDFCFC